MSLQTALVPPPLPRAAAHFVPRATAVPRPADPPPRRYSFHGVPVELSGSVELLGTEVERWLGPFGVAPVSAGHQTPVVGTFRRYEQREVMRHLSPGAVRLAMSGQREAAAMELYQDGERFWLVDDRWGMAELNLLKGAWRTWLLPRPTIDPGRCAELALLWPLAQLLRGRGLSLLPAASVERDGVGTLILSPFDIDDELSFLTRSGFRVVGRRWSAMREADGRVELLDVPGRLEPSADCKLLLDGDPGEPPASPTRVATCDAVIVIEPARRPTARVNALPSQIALDVLRRAWPIVEVPRGKRQWSMKLAALRCQCHAAELSRRPEDLHAMLVSLREPAASDTPAASSPIRRFVPALVQA